jgi:glycosyltransferase involved in cell wall biosynthesis
MSKVLIDARELRTSTGRYVERMLHYLQQVDLENDYIILLTPKDIDGWLPNNPRFTKVATKYKEFTFGEQLGLLRQIRKLKPDLVHFPMVQQPVLYRGRTVTTLQDLTTCRFRNPSKNLIVFSIKQQIYKAINWYIPRKATEIITPSEFVKRDIIRFAHLPNDKKFTVTYESSDFIDETPAPLPDLTNKKFIMYVGRPLPHKNLERLIDTFALLRQRHPDLHLVLVGKEDALYRRHKQYVGRQGIKGITFTGFVSEASLRWLYENTLAYIFPSLSEGFGLPPLEAMRHGAPVAASDATCIPEVLGDAAHYFNPLNIQDMATKIAEVIDNEALRKNLIEAGAAQAQKYSWQRMAEQTLAVYKKALDE